MATKPTTQVQPVYGTARGSHGAYSNRGCRCPECRAGSTAYARRYRATAKGRETDRRYYASDKGRATRRAAQKRYQASDAGKLVQRRYDATAKGFLRRDRATTKAMIQQVERLEEEIA